MYIDESGTSSPTYQPSFPYILTGIVVEASKQKELKDIFNELKIKYWGKADIVLHSEDIGKNINECSIFRSNGKLKAEFIDDLIDAIHRAPILCFHAIIDKTKISSTWQETTIIKKTGQSVIFNFLAYLLTRKTDVRSKIIIEASSVFKDAEYLKAFTVFLSPGNKLVDSDFPDFDIIKKSLTQISYVTKLNNDTETQLADILSYAASCKYREIMGASYSANSYKARICKVLDEKLFVMPTTVPVSKRAMLNKINSFDIITP